MVQIQRVRGNKGYESISRDSLQNQALSFKARGIMAYLESMPDEWVVHGVKGIAAASDGDGHFSVNEGLKELEAAGLLARLKRQGPRAQWQWLWIYSDNPVDVAEAVREWIAAGTVSSRGGNPQPMRPSSVPVPATDPPVPVLQFPVDGEPVDGEPLNREVNSRETSITRDKSLVSDTSTAADGASVEASLKPSQRSDAVDTPTGSLWGHDQDLFAGDQLSPEPVVTAQTVTAAWIDAFQANGVKPTKSQIGQAARAAKELLAAGNDPNRVIEAAVVAASKGYPTIDRELATFGRNGHNPPRRPASDVAAAQVAERFAAKRARDQLALPEGSRS
jgi:hypothetical protein